MAEAEAKGTEPFDNLDEAVLHQLSGGKSAPMELQSNLNIRPKDLALRIYKLFKQGFLIYELKSGTADVMLTEAGFLKAKPAVTKPTTPAPSMQQAPKPAQAAPVQEQQGEQTTAPRHGKPIGIAIPILVVLIIIVIVVAVLNYYKIINWGI